MVKLDYKRLVRKTKTMRTIKEALEEATQKLKTNGVEEPRRDAALLLSHILKKDHAFLIAHDKDLLDEKILQDYFALIERRTLSEPLQYITGKQEFFGLDFEVTSDVLIPRPETEILVEAALEIINSKFKIQNSKTDNTQQTKDKEQRSKDEEQLITHHSSLITPLACDVGVGSGCIIVSLLHEINYLCGVGLDISENALHIAERNAKRHGVDERLMLFESDCFSALEGKDFEFDLIVSNPPYINETDFQTLQNEVKNYEPRTALTPEGNGLRIIKKLIEDVHQFLKPNGYLLIEIGYDQSEIVKDLVDEKIWTLVEIGKDLQDIPRIVVLRKALL